MATIQGFCNSAVFQKFQSPYGDSVNGDPIGYVQIHDYVKFQSPYGDSVNGDFSIKLYTTNCVRFQSPYGDSVNGDYNPVADLNYRSQVSVPLRGFSEWRLRNYSPILYAPLLFQSPYGDSVNGDIELAVGVATSVTSFSPLTGIQ